MRSKRGCLFREGRVAVVGCGTLEVYNQAAECCVLRDHQTLVLFLEQAKSDEMTIPDEVDIIVTGGGSCGFVVTSMMA